MTVFLQWVAMFLGGGGGGGGGFRGELAKVVGCHVSRCSIHSTRLGAGLKAASEVEKLESCPSARSSIY